jgi:CMP/dCMP kinase
MHGHRSPKALEETDVPVVTISRQYASGGGDIAQRVAKELNAFLLDRELIHEAAQRLGLPEDVVSEHDERGETILGRLVNALRMSYPDASSMPDLIDLPGDVPDLPNRAYVQVVEQVIQETARSGNVVIVGRGSQFVLQNHTGALHVHVFAPLDTRVQAVMNEQPGTSRQDAERVVRDFDGARGRYARLFYHSDWLSPQHYHLVLNTGRMSNETAVKLIIDAVQDLD